MFNHHQPTLITTSSGSGKTQVSTAPVEFGGLCILPSGAELDACRDGQVVMDVDQDLVERWRDGYGYWVVRWPSGGDMEAGEKLWGDTSGS
jgi:hypothetical protein